VSLVRVEGCDFDDDDDDDDDEEEEDDDTCTGDMSAGDNEEKSNSLS